MFNRKKVKELEETVQRGKDAYDSLHNLYVIEEERYDKLHLQYTLVKEEYKYLKEELSKNKLMSFPTKNFNIKKATQLLTNDLSAKALSTFLFQLVEALSESHLVSLNNYTLRRLTKIKDNVKAF